MVWNQLCDGLARELAAKTGTPLVIYSEGKIKKLRIRPKPATRSS
jgi:diaminopimelate decarboxylase